MGPEPKALHEVWEELADMTWGKLENAALILTLTAVVVGLAAMARCQETWKVLPEPPPRKVSFWTMRNVQDPPLRKNRETLKSPWYIVPHVLAVGASVANVTRARKQGAGYGDAMVGAVGVGAFGFVMDRYVWRPFSVAGGCAVTILRGYGAVRRKYE